jgi:hypothetical protein
LPVSRAWMRFTYFRSEPRRRHARSPRSSASRGGSAPSARQGPVRSQNDLQQRPRSSGPSRRSEVPMSRKACPEGRTPSRAPRATRPSRGKSRSPEKVPPAPAPRRGCRAKSRGVDGVRGS